jgi:hypothetical protein
MATYVVNYTDVSKSPINVEERDVDRSVAIALFGRRKLKYGEELNENLLHILENFACPDTNERVHLENSNIPLSGTPQLDPDTVEGGALVSTLANAVEGQLWYNSTNQTMYKKTGPAVTDWTPLGGLADITAISGSLLSASDGNGSFTVPLPLPVSNRGYVYTPNECVWVVSSRHYPSDISDMTCEVNMINYDPVVTMEYTPVGGAKQAGVVNYHVIGIKGQTFTAQIPPPITSVKSDFRTLTLTDSYETVVTNPIIIDDNTRITIHFDNSGSMEDTYQPLLIMQSEILMDILLPFYDYDEDKYNEMVTVISHKYEVYDNITVWERTLLWMSMVSDNPETTKEIQLIFQDESSQLDGLSYIHQASGFDQFDPPHANFVADNNRLQAILDASITPEYFRGIFYAVEGDDSRAEDFVDLLIASRDGTGQYSGSSGLSNYPDNFGYVFNVTDGGTPEYYADLIIDGINALGYNIPPRVP